MHRNQTLSCSPAEMKFNIPNYLLHFLQVQNNLNLLPTKNEDIFISSKLILRDNCSWEEKIRAPTYIFKIKRDA